MARIISKPNWLNESTIESKAAMLLREFAAESGEIISPPIPIQRLIEEHLDLTIDWCALEDEPGQPILACIDPRDRVIRMNEAHLDFFEQFFGSENFTFAHEVGHWTLHVDHSGATQLTFFDVPQQPFICRAPNNAPLNSFEWQANRFAACLMMPEWLVRDCASAVDIYSWPALYALKDDFQVTISAFVKRLADLGLLYVAPGHKLYPSEEIFRGQQKLA